MESMESHEAGFPPFPHPLEIPAGIPTFPRLRDDYHVSEDRQSPPKTRNQSHSHRKGLVNHVPGLKRKGCPGTLTPLSGVWRLSFRVGVAGRNEAVTKLYARTQLITDPTSKLATTWEFRDNNYRY